MPGKDGSAVCFGQPQGNTLRGSAGNYQSLRMQPWMHMADPCNLSPSPSPPPLQDPARVRLHEEESRLTKRIGASKIELDNLKRAAKAHDKKLNKLRKDLAQLQEAKVEPQHIVCSLVIRNTRQHCGNPEQATRCLLILQQLASASLDSS